MYLSFMHFKWTNFDCLSMDMFISSMMDVVIILAKLVCHHCFVCKLNYLFGVHMCYGGVIALVTISSINSAVLQYLYWFLVSWVHGVCWWGHYKIHKNDTSKALQCTHHIVLLGYATIKLAKLKIINDTVTSIIGKWGKLRRILLDVFKCTEVGLSYVCNNISTQMAPLVWITLRRYLLLAARFLQVCGGIDPYTPMAAYGRVEGGGPTR
jgi:hypothetical protein